MNVRPEDAATMGLWPRMRKISIEPRNVLQIHKIAATHAKLNILRNYDMSMRWSASEVRRWCRLCGLAGPASGNDLRFLGSPTSETMHYFRDWCCVGEESGHCNDSRPIEGRRSAESFNPCPAVAKGEPAGVILRTRRNDDFAVIAALRWAFLFRVASGWNGVEPEVQRQTRQESSHMYGSRRANDEAKGAEIHCRRTPCSRKL